MATISDKWKNELNSLSKQDYIVLTKAILFDLPEPKISESNQFIAHRIYAGLEKTEYNRLAKQKAKQKSLKSNGIQSEFNLNSIQEERKEGAPLSSPLFPSPTPLTNYPPIIPPEEKREEYTPSLTVPPTETETRKPSLESRFEELWKLYPKKAGKTSALADYKRAVKDGVTDEEIADGINRYTEHIRNTRTEQKYIMQGSTYFHQRRWTDEYNDGATTTLTAEELEEMRAVFG